MPILKHNKDPKLLSSYRPISLLSCKDKIFEKIILDRLKKFTDKNNVINKFQSGFKAKHSRGHQVKRVVNIIKTNKQKKVFNWCGIFRY